MTNCVYLPVLELETFYWGTAKKNPPWELMIAKKKSGKGKTEKYP